MKVSIYTINDAMNYGSFLQVFATQEFLKKEGADVVVSNKTRTRFGIIKYTLGRSINHTVFKIHRYKAYKKDWAYLNRGDFRNADASIIGSDEIWNEDNKYFFHAKEYYGYGLNGRVIAYAPSIGYTNPDVLLHNEKIINGIKNNFYRIFPRDNNTLELVKKITDKNPIKVVDPTILLCGRWEEFQKPINYKLDKDYLLYYGYSESPDYKKQLLDYAHKNNLLVVGVGFDYSWTDLNIIASPFQFLYLIKHAKYVFTTTFHGTVLSTLLGANFIVKPNGQKILDFIQTYDLVNRSVDNVNEENLSNIYNGCINYDAVYNKLNEDAENSRTILRASLYE